MENFPKGKLCQLLDKMKISSAFPLLFFFFFLNIFWGAALLDAFVSKAKVVHAV